MTRKDYIAIAAALKASRAPLIAGSNVIANDAARRQWYNVVNAMAGVMAAGNPRFVASRFFDECGVPS